MHLNFKTMIKNLKKFVLPIVLLMSFVFLLFLINQVSGIYLMASELNPVFGKVVLVTLSVISLVLIASPFVILFKMPKPMKRPENEQELIPYKKQLFKRLQKSKFLLEREAVPYQVEDLPKAITLLDEEADRLIKSTSKTIFLATAISQNGKLDALTVFLSQMRLVWKVAHVYYQRPSSKELVYLYGNVGATAFLAGQIEDVDLAEHLEPIVTSIAKNASGRSVPVIGPTATIVLDSLMEGTTNAFLSLRVGILSKKYCNQLTVSTKREIRSSTLKEASKMLRKIAVESSGTIISTIISATKKAGIETIKNSWDGMVKTGEKVKDTVVDVSKKMNPFKKKEEAEAE